MEMSIRKIGMWRALFQSGSQFLEQVKDLRSTSESTSQGECWNCIPFSTLFLLAHHTLFRVTWLLHCLMAACIISELQWAGVEAHHKQEHGFSLYHPARRGEGIKMGKVWDRKRCPPLVTLTFDGTTEKQGLLTFSSACFPCYVCVHLCSSLKYV